MTSSNDKRNTLLQLNINPITCGDHMAVRFNLLTSLSKSDISHKYQKYSYDLVIGFAPIDIFLN